MGITDPAIKKAISILNNGGIIIFPTDTAFGVGCRIDRPVTVDRLFRIRRRPRTQATPVLVASAQMALPYYDHPSNIVRHFMQTYWPGALTIVAPCVIDRVYSPIRGATRTIGMRMPNHTEALAVIAGVGVPILGPSANFHTAPTPYTQEQLDPELIQLVDYVLPGVCQVGNVSTVVDCTTQPYKILRQGAIVLPTST